MDLNEKIKAYTVRTWWSNEEGAYLAQCPSFPSLITQGDDRADAILDWEIMIFGVIDEMRQDGRDLPKPCKQEV